MAAKAFDVAWMSCTSVSCACTLRLSPPHSSSPGLVTWGLEQGTVGTHGLYEGGGDITSDP